MTMIDAIIVLITATIVVSTIVCAIKKKKKGGGCGCSGCPHGAKCHGAAENRKKAK